MRIPDHLTCLLRNLYAGQEATARTRHGTTDWFKIGKGVKQGCILSPCLSKLYAEYIMWNARLDEPQARIRIAGRNINNLRYADDTTLMVESEEDLKSLLMGVKEESEKAGLKFNIWKTKIMASSPIRSWQSVGGRREALRPWQRSWGRRLDIRKGGIEPQESPWKSSSIYPHNQSLPTLLLCALTYTSGFTGGCPPPPLSEKELT